MGLKMLDLFHRYKEHEIARMVMRSTPTVVHRLDPRGEVKDEREVNGLRKPEKRPPVKERLQRRLERQEEVLETVKVYAGDGAMTVEQILYHLGYPSKEQAGADLQDLYDRGFLNRQKITNREGKRVWAYWVARA